MKKLVCLILLSPLFLNSQLSVAADCSRDDVVFYLKQGFSHDQVTKICHTAKGNVVQSNQSSSVPQGNAQASTAHTNNNQAYADKMIFFKSSIDSDELEITQSHLILTKNRECIKYGIEGGSGFRDKACVKLQTKIQLPGLKIVKAKNSIPLLGTPELIIEGNIEHHILNLETLSSKKRKGLLEDFNLKPRKLELALRGGVNPKRVEEKLSTLIH